MVQPSRFRRKDYATLTEQSQIQWDGSSIRVRLPTRSVPYHPSDASAKFLGRDDRRNFLRNERWCAHQFIQRKPSGTSRRRSSLPQANGHAVLGRSSDKLSFQGAAEFFWSLFIAPLQ